MADFFPPTVEEAISELKREASMRSHVYPRLVEQGRLKADEAERRSARLSKAIDTLEKIVKKP